VPWCPLYRKLGGAQAGLDKYNLAPCWGSNTEPNYYNRLRLIREFKTMYVKILGKKML
jgi:hypothetical protein